MSFLFKMFCIHIHQKQVKQCQTDLLSATNNGKKSPKTTHHRHNRRALVVNCGETACVADFWPGQAVTG